MNNSDQNETVRSWGETYPTKFPCPACKAKPNRPCRRPGGELYSPTWYHDARKHYRDGWLDGRDAGVDQSVGALTDLVLGAVQRILPADKEPKRLLRRISGGG